MEIIDPLRIKIQELLSLGYPNPLNQARLRYGSQVDIVELEKQVSNYQTENNLFLLVDFTPFERIGHIKEFLDTLNKYSKSRPVLMVISDIILLEINSIYQNPPLLVVKFSKNGKYEVIIGGSKEDQKLKHLIIKEIKSKNGDDLLEFRRRIADYNLTKLLYEPNCLDIPCAHDVRYPISYLSGRYYRIMPNNMLVSCYLNLKEIGRNYEALTKLAYEVVLALMEYFKRDVDPLKKFKYIVSPNNTSLFLASSVQAIIDMPVVIVDKLGPIPARNLNTNKLSELLTSKTVVLIEEVVATGNEVDRSVLFLSNLKSDIYKIITLYNLEVGNPMLIESQDMISLCKPKKTLKYEYRSQ